MRSLVIGLVVTSALVACCDVQPTAFGPDTPPPPAAVHVGAVATAAASVKVAVEDAGDAGAAPAKTPASLFDEQGVSDATDSGALDPRAPLAAPVITMTAAGKARFAALPERQGTIPVLLFHQVCPVKCGPEATYGTTQAELMKMMLAIQSAGYTTLSIADYVRAIQGNTTGLPPRPLLVTFDDGRLDAYRGADDVLRVLGVKATMYILTAELDRNPAFRMQGADVDAAFASGRWDIQLHAHAGHVQIQAGVDDAGAAVLLPFYAARKYSSGLESFDAWKLRAEEDVATGETLLAARTSGHDYAALSFAVPYGNYGQVETNDAAIPTELRSFLDAHFAVWFTQTNDVPTAPSSASHEAHRYTVFRTTTAEMLYDWLAR